MITGDDGKLLVLAPLERRKLRHTDFDDFEPLLCNLERQSVVALPLNEASIARGLIFGGVIWALIILGVIGIFMDSSLFWILGPAAIALAAVIFVVAEQKGATVVRRWTAQLAALVIVLRGRHRAARVGDLLQCRGRRARPARVRGRNALGGTARPDAAGARPPTPLPCGRVTAAGAPLFPVRPPAAGDAPRAVRAAHVPARPVDPDALRRPREVRLAPHRGLWPGCGARRRPGAARPPLTGARRDDRDHPRLALDHAEPGRRPDHRPCGHRPALPARSLDDRLRVPRRLLLRTHD